MRSELGLELGSEGRAVPLSSESRQAGHTYAREDRFAVVCSPEHRGQVGTMLAGFQLGEEREGERSSFSLNGSVFCHGSRIRCKTGH